MWLYGIHAVQAALRHHKRVLHHCVIQKDMKEQHHVIQRLAEQRGCPLSWLPRAQLTQTLPSQAVHQGVALQCHFLREFDLTRFLTQTPHAQRLVILDHVTDPHNMGAIMRSAHLFGWEGLICCRKESPPQGAILAKAASGALERLPIVRVHQLSEAIKQLQKLQFFCLALDGNSPAVLEAVAHHERLALLLGAEGRGVHAKLLRLADAAAAIATHDNAMGLNVSNAAAIAFYQLQKK